MNVEKEKSVISIDPAEVNPDFVWGDKQRVLEIIGLGSGRGFGIEDVNLPNNWENSLDKLKDIDREYLENNYLNICAKVGKCALRKIVLDPNNVLKELLIENIQSKSVSRMYLSDQAGKLEKGIYSSENINDIESAMAFQEMMASYFSFVWGYNFSYGNVFCTQGDSMFRAGYYPVRLKIPEKIYELSKSNILSGRGHQDDLRYYMENVTGRFGLDYRKNVIVFNNRGILNSVAVEGDATCYYLANGGANVKYEAHNVDTAYQAAALHDIVAKHLNYLNDNFVHEE